jgi:hypothetical protein
MKNAVRGTGWWNMVVLLTAGLVLSGCSNERRLAKGKPLRNLPPNAILETADAAALQWDWISMKVDAEVSGPERKDSFKATVRMAKDSVIWMSLTPALGVEVVRVMLTQDSVHMFSKIPGNKFAFTGSYESISEWVGTPMSFANVQDLLTGRPMGLNPEEDKFLSRVDEQQYALIGKYKRPVRRLVGADDRDLAPDDSLAMEASERRHERMRNRKEEEELLVKRHWFDGLTFDPVRDVFDDLYYLRTVTIEREDFVLEEHTEMPVGRWPQHIMLTLQAPEGNAEIDLEITRSRLNKPTDFPFEVPANLEFRDAF